MAATEELDTDDEDDDEDEEEEVDAGVVAAPVPAEARAAARKAAIREPGAAAIASLPADGADAVDVSSFAFTPAVE